MLLKNHRWKQHFNPQWTSCIRLIEICCCDLWLIVCFRGKQTVSGWASEFDALVTVTAVVTTVDRNAMSATGTAVLVATALVLLQCAATGCAGQSAAIRHGRSRNARNLRPNLQAPAKPQQTATATVSELGNDIVNRLLRIVESQQQLGDNCTAGTHLNLGEGVVDRYAQVSDVFTNDYIPIKVYKTKNTNLWQKNFQRISRE